MGTWKARSLRSWPTTADGDLNEEASREAAARNVPLNVNDVTHLCTWIAPSMVRNGDVIIAASTGGTSPALARKLREELAGTSRTGSRFRPIEYGDLAPLLSEVRTELLGRGIRPKPDHWQAEHHRGPDGHGAVGGGGAREGDAAVQPDDGRGLRLPRPHLQDVGGASRLLSLDGRGLR